MVIGFPVEKYPLGGLNNLTPRQKYEYALSDEECVIFETTDEFFDMLNNDLIDTENNFWFDVPR